MLPRWARYSKFVRVVMLLSRKPWRVDQCARV